MSMTPIQLQAHRFAERLADEGVTEATEAFLEALDGMYSPRSAGIFALEVMDILRDEDLDRAAAVMGYIRRRKQAGVVRPLRG